MKVAIITTYAHKVYTARKELLNELKRLDFQLTVMGPEKEELCLPELEKLDIEYIELNIQRVNLNPLKEILSVHDIQKKLMANKIDCVLVYGIRMIPSVVLAAKLAKVKRVVCIINGAGNLLMSNGAKSKIAQAISFPMLSLMLRQANKVIFQNKDDYKEFKRKHLVSENNICFTNGSGVNTTLYKPTPIPKELEFLLVTRVTGSKGTNEYVKASRVIKDRYPEARFGLVGPKDDNDGSVDWGAIEEAINEGALQYYGETQNVMKYLEKCRIYVFPSYYREGVPRSVLEAMAVGRPIITTNSPGCKETVTNGINGFLVPPKNTEALVDKITWMIENSEKVELMGNESRRLAVEKFDVNKVNEIIVQQLLGK